MTKPVIIGFIALALSIATLGYTISEQRYRAGYMQGSVDGIRLAVEHFRR